MWKILLEEFLGGHESIQKVGGRGVFQNEVKAPTVVESPGRGPVAERAGLDVAEDGLGSVPAGMSDLLGAKAEIHVLVVTGPESLIQPSHLV